MAGQIDLNADLGEGYGQDAALMRLVSSCNIACGGHAGDRTSMRAALIAAREACVAAGAHPSYPDRAGFGRRAVVLEPGHLLEQLVEQVDTLKDLARQEGVALTHIKPHGALYHAAASEAGTAGMMVELMRTSLPSGRLIGPPQGAMRTAAAKSGVAYLSEGFADRAYLDRGTLVPRDQDGAVLDTHDARTQQALDLARLGTVLATSGRRIPLSVQTVCLHGDTPGALESARAVRQALLQAGIAIRAPQ